MVEAGGFEPPKGEARQIYSLLPLTARPHLRKLESENLKRVHLEREKLAKILGGAVVRVEPAPGIEPRTY